MTRRRSFGATAKQARLRASGASARHARLRLLLLVAALGFAARPAAAQTEIVEYYGHDALGSIRIVFTASGVATARADYEPFGEAVTIAGMPAGPLPAQQFTGQERDALERQDYFGARYYRPRHGRFSQVDPVYAGLFDPQQWNRYAYARNNPLSFVDPDGRRTREAADLTSCAYILSINKNDTPCTWLTGGGNVSAVATLWGNELRQDPRSGGTIVRGGATDRRARLPGEGAIETLVTLVEWATGTLAPDVEASSAAAADLSASPAMQEILDQFADQGCDTSSVYGGDFQYAQLATTTTVTGQLVGGFVARFESVGDGTYVDVHAWNTWGLESATRLPSLGGNNRRNASVQQMVFGGHDFTYPKSLLEDRSTGMMRNVTVHYRWTQRSPCAR